MPISLELQSQHLPHFSSLSSRQTHPLWGAKGDLGLVAWKCLWRPVGCMPMSCLLARKVVKAIGAGNSICQDCGWQTRKPQLSWVDEKPLIKIDTGGLPFSIGKKFLLTNRNWAKACKIIWCSLKDTSISVFYFHHWWSMRSHIYIVPLRRRSNLLCVY